MSESIYRKKSLDRMKSPDTLDQYIHVANPSGWILLTAILCLLIGVNVWGIWGKIESTVSTQMFVENGTAVGAVLTNDIDRIQTGMTVRIGKTEGTVWSVEPEDHTVTAKLIVPDGSYQAEIVTETIHPMSLIFN